MKKILFLLLISVKVFSQTGIGTTTPNASAKLDITSANKGFLPPRVALTSSSVFAPVTGLSGTTELATAAGLLVYNTATAGTSPNNVTPGFYYWSGTAWIRLTIPADNAANVTGTVAVANGGTGTTTGSITGSGALTFTAGGSNQSVTLTPSGTGDVIVSSDLGIGTTNVTDRLIIGSAVAVHDGGNKVMGFGWSPGSSNSIVAGYPAEIRLDPGNGRLSFGTDPSLRSIGSAAGVQRRMTITSGGSVGIGTETPSARLHVQSANANSIYVESTAADNNGIVILNANTDQNWNNWYHEFIYFQRKGSNIGNITGSQNQVSYNSSSDYRLKTDFKNYNGLELVNKIKTYDYAWRSNNSRMYGVMAHELQNIIPYAVSGTKDAVDKEGKITPQAVDYSKLTPILVKAIQEQDAQIQTLEQRIIQLEKLIQNKQ